MATIKHNLANYVLTVVVFLPSISHGGTAIVKSDDLGKCVAKLIHDKMSPVAVISRLAAADKLRTEAAKTQLAQSEPDPTDIQNSPILKYLIPFSKQDSYEVMAFHSSPLIDYQAFHWGKGLVTEGYLNRLGDLYRDHISDKQHDFTLEKGFLNYLNAEKPIQRREAAAGDDQPFFIRMIFAADGITDRFVKDMLQNPNKQSLEPWELIKRTTDLYDGDVLTALAVIGYTFDMERVSIVDMRISAEQRTRSKRLYLGSRMKPLFSDGDALGQNYHFWMYVNAAIQGKYWSAKIMSVTYQNLAGNAKEQQADNLGLNTGAYIRNALLHPPSTYTCPLEPLPTRTDDAPPPGAAITR